MPRYLLMSRLGHPLLVRYAYTIFTEESKGKKSDRRYPYQKLGSAYSQVLNLMRAHRTKKDMGDDSYNPDNKIEIRALTAEEWEQDLNEEEQ